MIESLVKQDIFFSWQGSANKPQMCTVEMVRWVDNLKSSIEYDQHVFYHVLAGDVICQDVSCPATFQRQVFFVAFEDVCPRVLESLESLKPQNYLRLPKDKR